MDDVRSLMIVFGDAKRSVIFAWWAPPARVEEPVAEEDEDELVVMTRGANRKSAPFPGLAPLLPPERDGA